MVCGIGLVNIKPSLKTKLASTLSVVLQMPPQPSPIGLAIRFAAQCVVVAGGIEAAGVGLQLFGIDDDMLFAKSLVSQMDSGEAGEGDVQQTTCAVAAHDVFELACAEMYVDVEARLELLREVLWQCQCRRGQGHDNTKNHRIEAVINK